VENMAITVSDILKVKGHEVFSITPDAGVHAALQLLADKNIGALPVVQSEKLIGIFSERDYVRKLVLEGKFSKVTTIREVMTKNVFTVGTADNIEYCMELMSEKRIRHLPVIEEHRLVGMVSIGDIVKAIIADQKSTIGLLERYITGERG
jgi:CBS domain-containing protein